jgi:hypothetical protein
MDTNSSIKLTAIDSGAPEPGAPDRRALLGRGTDSCNIMH